MQIIEHEPPIAVEDSLRPFVSPAGIAVIGATPDPRKLGFALARNLKASGYTGEIHFVNPRGGELHGQVIHPSITDVPGTVDLAVVLTPAAAAPGVIDACGERGIRAVILASGGFRETGSEGARLERACLEAARRHGIRLIGPNCIGIFDAHIPFDTTFLQPPGPSPGPVAFVSHSGAICAAMVDWANGMGMGLSRLVSLGNQADVDETEMMALVATSEHTRVLTMYLEGVSDGEAFVREASRITRSKPIVALKVGRTDAGRRAAASHTGALAGTDTAVEAAFRRSGIIRVPGTEELLEWARVLAWCSLPAGKNVAVLTNAGGPGVAAADAIEAQGLHLARLSEASRLQLEDILPREASLANPVDMLASATPGQYAECLEILLEDPGVDAVIVLFPPPPGSTAVAVARALLDVLEMRAKPVMVVLLGDSLVEEAARELQSAQVPEFRFPERAVAALAVLEARARFLRQVSITRIPEGVDALGAEAILTTAAVDESGFLDTADAVRVLRCYGIPALGTVLVTSPREAEAASRCIGFPVAMKLSSPSIQHKSDVDGVILGISDADEAARAAATIIDRARAARPDARVDGVVVQKMAPPGQEVIVGSVRDPQFGPMVMFGSGGIEVEGLRDVAFALAPAPDHEIDEMIDGTWAGRKLSGFRSIPPADREAVADAIRRIGKLLIDLPGVVEVEINPLRVLAHGEGVLAIDARVRIASPALPCPLERTRGARPVPSR
jgi:acetate---CoA ligase (ADP-forming)